MKIFCPAIILALLCFHDTARGMADNAAATSAGQAKQNQGRILPNDTPSTLTANPTAPASGRPDTDLRKLPPEIQVKLKQFQSAAEAFIRRQDELKKKLDGATTDKERAEIRERIKESIEQWREQAKEFRDEARERAKDLQRELPKHREALDDSVKGLNQGGRGRRPGLD